MKAFLKGKITELNTKKAKIIEACDTSEDVVELKGFNARMEELNGEIKSFEAQLGKLEADDAPPTVSGPVTKGFNPITAFYGMGDPNKSEGFKSEDTKALELQGEIFKGNDSTQKTVVLNQEILVPKHQSSNVKKLPWNEVSSILDLVTSVPFANGESHAVPFEYEVGEGDYTAEPGADGAGGMYANTETKFDYSTVGKSFITAYAEISKQFMKTPSANYAVRVRENTLTSLRKKMARDIFIGAGGDNALQGIFTQPKTIKNDDGKTTRPNRTIGKDLEVNALTADMINDIIFGYGGDTDVENPKILVMHLQTLNELSRIRDNNGNRIYKITVDGNKFTIDNINGIFTSHIKPFAECAAGEYFIGYGDPSAYELAFYSGVEMGKSTHFKFNQGIICYSGDVFVGGNLTAYQSWVRVSKKA